VNASDPVKAARLSGNACAVLVERRRTDKEKLAGVNVEMLRARAMEPSSAPTQPVESTFSRQPLSAEWRDRSVEPECTAE
jgi:hypothetical protein